MTVGDELLASRRAHVRYRRLHDDSKNSDLAGQTQAVVEAMTARQTAHERDPLHTDPEWANDTAAHATLMAFYEKYLRG